MSYKCNNPIDIVYNVKLTHFRVFPFRATRIRSILMRNYGILDSWCLEDVLADVSRLLVSDALG